MSDQIGGNDGEGKHGQARALAEAAQRAREAGDGDRADRLEQAARRTDPGAVEDLLMELAPDATAADPSAAPDDAEVARISRTIEPHADAPSRAGITGAGSGADSM